MFGPTCSSIIICKQIINPQKHKTKTDKTEREKLTEDAKRNDTKRCQAQNKAKQTDDIIKIVLRIYANIDGTKVCAPATSYLLLYCMRACA